MSRYVMHRGWQDHPLFEGDEFSRRDAWEWMIAEAVWKDTQKGIGGGRKVALRRGQMTHSIRFMAGRWGWSKSRVERFLAQLRSETMIETVGGASQIIITICKYDRYQLQPGNSETDSETLFGTLPRQQRDKVEEGKEVKESNIDDLNARADEIGNWCQRRLNAPWIYSFSPVLAWMDWGADFQRDVKPVVERYIATNGGKPPRSLNWLDDRIASSIKQRTKTMPQGGQNAKPTSRHTGFAEIDYHAGAKDSGFVTD